MRLKKRYLLLLIVLLIIVFGSIIAFTRPVLPTIQLPGEVYPGTQGFWPEFLFNGIGITIIPYQAVARDVAAGQMFCARIEGRSLVRETGWVYPKMSRTPRAVQEVIRAFERVRPKLKLAP